MMGENLSREDGHAEKLLALAADCRKRIDTMTDPYRIDRLRRATEGLEAAAARTKATQSLARKG